MVEDSLGSRRPEMGAWYNSGVVLIEGIPLVLRDWERECINNPTQGDQEVYIYLWKEMQLKNLVQSIPYRMNTIR